MDEPTRDLVERAQRRDAQAAGLLFERYRQRLLLALRRACGGAELGGVMDSEDLVQDASLAAFKGLETFEYRGQGSFLAWLLQTARRELLQRLRARAAKKRAGAIRSIDSVSEPRADAPTPSQAAQGSELEERLQVCLDQLPGNERTAIILRRYFDADADEIRVELELPSAGAARALLSRAQTRLARLLDVAP